MATSVFLNFDSVTMGQFEQALTTMEEQDMQGLVIDLRSNPGGNLDTVCNMLELILPEGTIVSTKDRSGKEEEIRGSGKNDFDTPLAVLVNGYSASASEIFAGAVQDYKIGTIVGTTTYGKGVVQQLFPLDDGTCVKVTISEYFTPKGRNIDGKESSRMFGRVCQQMRKIRRLTINCRLRWMCFGNNRIQCTSVLKISAAWKEFIQSDEREGMSEGNTNLTFLFCAAMIK